MDQAGPGRRGAAVQPQPQARRLGAADAGAHAVEAAFAAGERVAPIEIDGYRVLRTGIHLGRPRKLGGDYFGVDVNVAARLADAARPGEVLVSDRALEQLPPGTAAAKKRRFRAKGAPSGMTAYAIVRPTA